MPYNYDEQIEYLTAHPQDIHHQWEAATGLFQFAARGNPSPYDSDCGCLTLIRRNSCMVAITNGEIDEALTQEIRNDTRLPKEVTSITLEHLPIFKYYQEKIDKLYETTT